MRRYFVLGLVVAACSNNSGGPGTPMDNLRFAIVGDTRPPSPDDTPGYPTYTITKIYQEIEAETPAVPFVVATGDYMFAQVGGTEQMPQLGLYMGARANYSGALYPAMGNHECTGATASNCNIVQTPNMQAYLNMMVAPIGETKPYYTKAFKANDRSWTAKLVFVACNAWDADQATWLAGELANPTTYTFVVRHEGTTALPDTQCMDSQTPIDANPFTLLIVGHSHYYAHIPEYKQVIVGIGGAPLTSGTNYGYVLVDRNDDGTITLTAKDYETKAVFDTFKLDASGDAVK